MAITIPFMLVSPNPYTQAPLDSVSALPLQLCGRSHSHPSCMSPLLPKFQILSACWGKAIAQWLRCSATNRKVAGSIPAGFSGFFMDIKSLRSHYGPGVNSASNRNEYQEYFLGVKAAGA